MAHLPGSGTLCRLRVIFAKQPHRSTHCTHSNGGLRCADPGNRHSPHMSIASRLIQQGTMCGSLAKSGVGEQKRTSALTDQVSGAVGKQIRPSMLTERSGGGVCEQNQPSMFTDQAPGVACEQKRPSALTRTGLKVVRRGRRCEGGGGAKGEGGVRAEFGFLRKRSGREDAGPQRADGVCPSAG